MFLNPSLFFYLHTSLSHSFPSYQHIPPCSLFIPPITIWVLFLHLHINLYNHTIFPALPSTVCFTRSHIYSCSLNLSTATTPVTPLSPYPKPRIQLPNLQNLHPLPTPCKPYINHSRIHALLLFSLIQNHTFRYPNLRNLYQLPTPSKPYPNHFIIFVSLRHLR